MGGRVPLRGAAPLPAPSSRAPVAGDEADDHAGHEHDGDRHADDPAEHGRLWERCHAREVAPAPVAQARRPGPDPDRNPTGTGVAGRRGRPRRPLRRGASSRPDARSSASAPTSATSGASSARSPGSATASRIGSSRRSSAPAATAARRARPPMRGASPPRRPGQGARHRHAGGRVLARPGDRQLARRPADPAPHRWGARGLDALTPPGYDAVVHVSLTDDPPLAQAFVVIEARPRKMTALRCGAGAVGLDARFGACGRLRSAGDLLMDQARVGEKTRKDEGVWRNHQGDLPGAHDRRDGPDLPVPAVQHPLGLADADAARRRLPVRLEIRLRLFPLLAAVRPPLFQGRIWGSEPKRGDIAVFKLPKDNATDYIKRVIGLPGDRIQMSRRRAPHQRRRR